MMNNPFMPGNPFPAPGSAPMPGGAQQNSDNFEVDLTGVTDPYRVPAGNYRVKCTEIEQSVSKGGNPMFVWTFTINEGVYTGREFKSFTALTPAAMWKVAETVIALGVGQQGTVVKFKRSDVLGKECGAVIEDTEYNGSTRSSISRVISLAELAEAQKG